MAREGVNWKMLKEGRKGVKGSYGGLGGYDWRYCQFKHYRTDTWEWEIKESKCQKNDESVWGKKVTETIKVCFGFMVMGGKPMTCFNCQEFGRIAKFCKEKKRCGIWSTSLLMWGRRETLADIQTIVSKRKSWTALGPDRILTSWLKNLTDSVHGETTQSG